MRATRGSRPHVGACCLCPSTSEVFTVCAVLVVGRDGPDADRGPPPPHGARDATPIYAGHRHRHTRCREIQSAYTASAIGVTAAGGAPRAARETRRVGGGGPELSRMFRTGGGAAPSREPRRAHKLELRSPQRPAPRRPSRQRHAAHLVRGARRSGSHSNSSQDTRLRRDTGHARAHTARHGSRESAPPPAATPPETRHPHPASRK